MRRSIWSSHQRLVVLVAGGLGHDRERIDSPAGDVRCDLLLVFGLIVTGFVCLRFFFLFDLFEGELMRLR